TFSAHFSVHLERASWPQSALGSALRPRSRYPRSHVGVSREAPMSETATPAVTPTATPATAPPTRPPSRRRLALVILAVVAAAALLILAGRSLGGYVPRFAQWVQGLGVWGPVVFILGYAAATVAFVPGLVLTLAAGAIFGVARGTVYTLIGATL